MVFSFSENLLKSLALNLPLTDQKGRSPLVSNNRSEKMETYNCVKAFIDQRMTPMCKYCSLWLQRWYGFNEKPQKFLCRHGFLPCFNEQQPPENP
jgi:hypothetical protein